MLDVCCNRLVFVDATGTMLIPGNTNLVPESTFDMFREFADGLLTPTTNTAVLAQIIHRVPDKHGLVT